MGYESIIAYGLDTLEDANEWLSEYKSKFLATQVAEPSILSSQKEDPMNRLYAHFDHADRNRIFSALIALKILIENGYTRESAKTRVSDQYKLTDPLWLEVEELYNAQATRRQLTNPPTIGTQNDHHA